ncbi:LppX_LprAFG lipoprotein [Streptomyces sp. NPDC087903]|uniref:LppX_LprAFG lipoprotein n=1 Tax=Streptomyces sp. NPDC087903 TaxID=3365819 RepID=UPI003807F129
MKTSVRGSARRRAAGAGLAALALAGGAVGCAKGDDESPAMEPAAAVAKAAKNAETITSFRYTMTGKVPDAGRVSGEAAMSVKPPAMSMKITAQDKGADGKVEIRLVDKAMYIGGGAQAAKEMDGKSWIKFDMSALGADKQLNPAQLGAGQADQNPATESTFLTGSKDVKKVGTETVDGVKTTHYKGNVTLDELEASLKGKDKATRKTREKSIAQYEKMGVDSLVMDMWIDGDDHTKKFRMRGDADKGPLDMTITFLDINKPVTVTAPPAKDTADLAEMMKDASGAES